jgi:cytochrome b subunit of formate dehydrogenase
MSDRAPAGGGPRVVRHKRPERFFHWLMAACMLVLLFTSFLPILGLKFPWVDIHWIAGVILIALVVFHVARALFVLRLAEMWVGPGEFIRSLAVTAREVSGGPREARRAGKYSVGQRVFHHLVALVVIAASITGVIMMVGIDSPFWERNPLFISEKARGVVFTVHGFAGMISISLIMVHVYFAFRPEKFYMTRSMLRGWITREEYEAKHDPALWPVDEG